MLCDQVRDPGNLGTVIRCADAFGADAVLVSRDSVDLYNAKMVRATTAACSICRSPLGSILPEAVTLARRLGLHVFGAESRARCTIDDLAASGELAQTTVWVLGNEAWGLTRRACEQAGPAGRAAALRTRREPQPLDCRGRPLVRLRHGPTCLTPHLSEHSWSSRRTVF